MCKNTCIKYFSMSPSAPPNTFSLVIEDNEVAKSISALEEVQLGDALLQWLFGTLKVCAFFLYL